MIRMSERKNSNEMHSAQEFIVAASVIARVNRRCSCHRWYKHQIGRKWDLDPWAIGLVPAVLPVVAMSKLVLAQARAGRMAARPACLNVFGGTPSCLGVSGRAWTLLGLAASWADWPWRVVAALTLLLLHGLVVRLLQPVVARDTNESRVHRPAMPPGDFARIRACILVSLDRMRSMWASIRWRFLGLVLVLDLEVFVLLVLVLVGDPFLLPYKTSLFRSLYEMNDGFLIMIWRSVAFGKFS